MENQSRGRRALRLAGASGLLAAAVLGAGANVAASQEAPAQPSSYEAVASAEGFRVSFGAPGFVAVDTFVDGGGPVSQAVIDGLGNSRAFASLPYPGDLAITGPGLVAGLTGLPSPPPYPFYASSSHPTTAEAKVAQPGYELAATSAEQSSKGSTMTGGGSEDGKSAIGKTVTVADTSRDASSGAVTAVATGTADLINVGGVLRIGQVDALAKVTRSPGTEPTREANFTVTGVTIADQAVGFSEAGFTLAGTNTPLPKDNPLLQALAEAKITVQYLARVENPDGVVSPGLVIRQEQATPGGPTMVFRYVFGRMAASATVSGSPTSIGDALPPLGTAPSDTAVASPPVSTDTPVDPAPSTGTDFLTASGPEPGPAGSAGSNSCSTESYDSAAATTTEPAPAEAAPVADTPPGNTVQEAAPISGTPMALVDTSSVYLTLVAGATVALLGGTVLRLMGVKLKWTS